MGPARQMTLGCVALVKPLVVLGLIDLVCRTAASFTGTGSSNERQIPPKSTHKESDYDEGDRRDGIVSCRVAVCLSGAIRSFVHRAVHSSIRGNLIEAIRADGCEVDVFAYATREDTVGRGKKATNSEFTPDASNIKAALAVLAPTRLIWHQEQAGIVPNSCSSAQGAFGEKEATQFGGGRYGGDNGTRNSSRWQISRPDASNNLYWQMYKSLAAYRMALREEKRKGQGFAFDWIIRGRFDVAWVRPLPPIRSFSAEAVWFGRHYWPMSDQFALVPRTLSDRYFESVKGFYACDGQSWPPPVTWWQPGCRIGFEESVLFRHLHASGVPYRFYFMFEYKITRGALGGMCHEAEVAFDEACNLLTVAQLFRYPFHGQQCSETLAEWAKLRCRALLPAKGMGEAHRTDAILSSNPRAWEELVETSPPQEKPRSQVGPETSDNGAPVTMGDSLWRTVVPTTVDVDHVRSKLVALGNAIIESVQPIRSPSSEDNLKIFDNFQAKNSSRSSRWDGWQVLPPWSVNSMTDCPLVEPRFPGLSPHVVSYYTMDSSLIRELAQTLKCFVRGLLEPSLGGEEAFDRSSCEGTRSLEAVMMDVALHTEELGVCTADDALGSSAMDYIADFFREPAVHCKGYGNVGDDRPLSRVI